MSFTRRVMVYLVGVALGCLLLLALPLKRPQAKPGDVVREQPAVTGHYPLIYQDGLGRKVRIAVQPRAYVSLAPSVTELLFALEVGGRVMAVTRWCERPAQARALPQVGGMDDPSREAIAGLRPDLVIGSTLTPRRVYEQLAEAGVVAVALDFSSLEATMAAIRELGSLLGVPGPALRLQHRLQEESRAVRSALERGAQGRPRALLLYDLDQLTSAGRGAWPGDLLELCGATNVAADALSPWPKLSLEAVLVADPEVLLLAVRPDPQARAAANARIAGLATHPAWSRVSAVRQNRVLLVDEDILTIPGPRIIEAQVQLAKAIHPEAFR